MIAGGKHLTLAVGPRRSCREERRADGWGGSKGERIQDLGMGGIERPTTIAQQAGLPNRLA